ncbi:MAG: Ig domain-containing protein [Gemmatimonadetes bacterium]|nr:Ig domain-containing protein [Gemmatimonadota bacterium]
MRYGEKSLGRAGAFSITTIALAAITLLVLSCGDGAVEPTPPPAPVATAVTVTPTAAELSALGATTRFSAQVRDQNGRVMAGASVAWSSSSASVATVDGSGVVTAAANGTATITATSGSASGSAAVTVAQSVGAVSVSPTADTLVAFGDTVRLVAEATDANRHAVVGAEFSWTSSDTAVARVDDSGLVTGVDEGTATITAMSGAASGRAAVTVAQSVGAVTITPAADTLVVADTVRLSAEATDANGHAVMGAEFSWASSDTLVAVVDSGGLVTAVAAGEAAINATSSGVTGRAAIVVAARAPTTVAVTPDTVAFTAVGQTMSLAAEVRDQIGRTMEGVTVSWSSGDRLVATVDSAGLVTFTAI